jgi:type IV pilus assembly protein PilM
MALLTTLLGSSSPAVIGLDLTASAIKLLELRRRGAGYAVESFAIEALPEGALADRQIVDAELVAAAIARAWKRSGSRTRRAAIAVPAAAVIAKTVSLPVGLGDDDMEAQIHAEADRYIPYPIEEVNLDFQPTGESDAGETEVLLVACRSEQIDSRVAALQLAGLEAAVVDVDSYAMERACSMLGAQLPDGGRGQSIAVADVGATGTTLLVLHDGRGVYTREQAFGGRQLIEEVMRRFALDAAAAERAQRLGELPQAYAAELLPHFFDDMAQQIDRGLQYFHSATAHPPVGRLLLAGGCAHLAGVAEALQQRLSLPVAVADPFNGIPLSAAARAARLPQLASSLLVAAGLALRAFDEPRR